MAPTKKNEKNKSKRIVSDSDSGSEKDSWDFKRNRSDSDSESDSKKKRKRSESPKKIQHSRSDSEGYKKSRNSYHVPKNLEKYQTVFELKKGKIEFVDQVFKIYNNKGNKPMSLTGDRMKLLVKNLNELQSLAADTQDEIGALLAEHADAISEENFKADHKGRSRREIPFPKIPNRDVKSVTIANSGNWEFRMILSVYDRKTSVMLRMIHHPNGDRYTDQWCKGGLLFVPEDNAEELKEFVSNLVN